MQGTPQDAADFGKPEKLHAPGVAVRGIATATGVGVLQTAVVLSKRRRLNTSHHK